MADNYALNANMGMKMGEAAGGMLGAGNAPQAQQLQQQMQVQQTVNLLKQFGVMKTENKGYTAGQLEQNLVTSGKQHGLSKVVFSNADTSGLSEEDRVSALLEMHKRFGVPLPKPEVNTEIDYKKMAEMGMKVDAGNGITIDPSAMIRKTGLYNQPQIQIPENLPELAPDASSEERKAWLSNLPPMVAKKVEMLASYDVPAKDLASVRSADRGNLLALAAMYKGGNFDASQYPIRQQFKQNWSTGLLGQNNRSFGMLAQHLDQFQETAKKLNNGNLIVANAGMNFLKRQKGAKEIADAKVAALAVATETAKALRGAGVLNEQEEKEWRETVNSNISSGQIESVPQSIAKLVEGRINENVNAYENMMGETPKNMLSKEAMKSLTKIFGGELPESLAKLESDNKSVNVNVESVKPGKEEGGYKFKGGDPADPKNWEKL